mmetsp:Transcript_8966/g.20357  ORF Transcript_8966/g.20357 Transcript_8966/m.20357 type:complete len:184 (-) Transcript_8966:14-565(-)
MCLPSVQGCEWWYGVTAPNMAPTNPDCKKLEAVSDIIHAKLYLCLCRFSDIMLILILIDLGWPPRPSSLDRLCVSGARHGVLKATLRAARCSLDSPLSSKRRMRVLCTSPGLSLSRHNRHNSGAGGADSAVSRQVLGVSVADIVRRPRRPFVRWCLRLRQRYEQQYGVRQCQFELAQGWRLRQ